MLVSPERSKDISLQNSTKNLKPGNANSKSQEVSSVVKDFLIDLATQKRIYELMRTNLAQKIESFKVGATAHDHVSQQFRELIESSNKDFFKLRGDLYNKGLDLTLEEIVKQKKYDFEWYRTKYSRPEENLQNIKVLAPGKSIKEESYLKDHVRNKFDREKMLKIMEHRLVSALLSENQKTEKKCQTPQKIGLNEAKDMYVARKYENFKRSIRGKILDEDYRLNDVASY